MTEIEFAEYIGTTFTIRGTQYRVTGFKASRPKYPVQAERLRDGRKIKVTVQGFLDAIEPAGPVEGLTAEIKRAFAGLTNRLSPENLSCDGECSRAQVAARKRAIMADWRALEARAGLSVKESDTWGW